MKFKVGDRVRYIEHDKENLRLDKQLFKLKKIYTITNIKVGEWLYLDDIERIVYTKQVELVSYVASPKYNLGDKVVYTGVGTSKEFRTINGILLTEEGIGYTMIGKGWGTIYWEYELEYYKKPQSYGVDLIGLTKKQFDKIMKIVE